MKTALISLDLINELCDPNGKLAAYADRISNTQVIENTNKIVEHLRQDQDNLIIHVKLGFRANYLDASSRSPIFSRIAENKLLAAGDWGSSVHPDLNVHSSDIMIDKHRVSAFYGTDLELILRAQQVDTVILTGIATNNAVELTAREAHDRDFHVVVVSDATEAGCDDDKQASLNFLSKVTQLKTTEEVLQAF